MIKDKLINKLKSYLVAGLLITGPMILTLYIISWIINIFDKTLLELSDFLEIDTSGLPIGSGLFFAICSLILIGFVFTNVLGSLFINLNHYIMMKLPIVKIIYNTIKQIFDTLLKKDDNNPRQVVLIEYPRKGIFTIGFLTSDLKGEIQNKIQEDSVCVFVPTSPNPTSGYIVFIPKQELVYLNLTAEKAMKLIISGGLLPEDESKDK